MLECSDVPKYKGEIRKKQIFSTLLLSNSHATSCLHNGTEKELSPIFQVTSRSNTGNVRERFVFGEGFSLEGQRGHYLASSSKIESDGTGLVENDHSNHSSGNFCLEWSEYR